MARGAHRGQRLDHAVEVGDALAAQRVGDARLLEEPPAARLGPEVQMTRIGAVEGDAEREREIALVLRRRERHEMAALAIRDATADLLQHARALQELGRQWPGRAIVGGDHVQPRAGLTRDDPGEECEVVVDDGLVDLATGDVDELQAGLPEQQQEEEQPFLVRLHDRAHVARRRTDRRHDDE